MAVSRKRINGADFPAEVLAVKKALQEANDPRLETMKLLTEVRLDELYINDLKTMWNRLAEYGGGFGEGGDTLWVYGFLKIVDKIKCLPEHFYINEEDRKDLIARIKFSTEELVRIHNAYLVDLFLSPSYSSSLGLCHESVKRLLPKFFDNEENASVVWGLLMLFAWYEQCNTRKGSI